MAKKGRRGRFTKQKKSKNAAQRAATRAAAKAEGQTLPGFNEKQKAAGAKAQADLARTTGADARDSIDQTEIARREEAVRSVLDKVVVKVCCTL